MEQEEIGASAAISQRQSDFPSSPVSSTDYEIVGKQSIHVKIQTTVLSNLF